MISAVYGGLFLLGITCPIKYIFGISCPGCGMSRACLSALKFDFSAAFAYHPLWILLLPSAAVIAYGSWRKKKRLLHVYIIAILVAMGAVYLWRIIFLSNEVVVFEPQNGLLWRGVRALLGGFSGT